MRVKSVPSVLDFAIFVAVTFFVLTALDIFLSRDQKEWLGIRTLHAWHWLAEARRTSLLDWLNWYHQAIAWVGVVVVSVYMTLAFEKALAPLAQVVAIALFIFVVGLLFGLMIIRFILAAPTLSRAGIRATISVMFTLAPAVIFLMAVHFFKSDFLDLAKAFAMGVKTHQPTLGPAVFALIYLWTLILWVHLTVISMIFWAVVIIPLLVIYLLTIVLFCCEFVVRRVAEYPKGPIVAGSVLLAALAGVLRVMLYTGH